MTDENAECRCLLTCRLPGEETEYGARFPMSRHAPICGHYKLEDFMVISFDGSSCVCEMDEGQEMLDDAERPEEYEVETVHITRDQFESLEEFQGF